MSLLSVVQAVCDEIGIPRPSSVVGSSDISALQLLSAAKSAVISEARRRNWTDLTVRHSFVAEASASVASYSLPADFDRFIDSTWYNDSDNRRVHVANAQAWQELTRGSLGNSGVDTWFRQYGGSLYIWPIRTSASAVFAYDYQSNYLVQTSAGSAKATFTADGDQVRLDEHLLKLDLIWRYRRGRGLAYADERLEFEDYLAQMMRDDGGAPNLDMGGQSLTNVLAVNVPEAGFGS